MSEYTELAESMMDDSINALVKRYAQDALILAFSILS